MGSFFTNVQVRIPDDALAESRVQEALRAMANADGYDEVASDAGIAARGASAPDRTILFQARDGWLSICDQQTEGQDSATLDRLAMHVSSALAAPAFSITVHDSDVLVLALFDEHGECRDRFDSHPEFFGKRSAKCKASVQGNPELWKHFLRAGASADDLKAAWSEKKLFCEETLAKTVALFGLAQERAAIGFNYADKQDVKYTRLALRLRVRPAHETKSAGPPQFEGGGYSPKAEMSVGFPMQLGAAARNTGGGARGVLAIVWGKAVDRGLFEISRANLVVGSARDNKHVEVAVAKTTLTTGAPAFVATFPDAEIPAGAQGGFAALAGLTPEKMVAAMYSSNVHVNLYGQGVAEGHDEFHISIAPMIDLARGHTHDIHAHVIAPSRRPLRAKLDVEAHVLRPLSSLSALFALVSFDLKKAEAASCAKEIATSILRFAATSGKYSIAVYHAEPGKRPSTGEAKADGFLESARFKKLGAQMIDETCVSATRGDSIWSSDPSGERDFGDGFAFGIPLFSSATKRDPDLPSLGVWISVAGMNAEKISEITAVMHAQMDRAMKDHKGVQTLVARWGWVPSTLDSTAYELASGVHGQCTQRRSWNRKFLRGLAVGTSWLSAELAANIPNLDALRSCANVESIGTALKITIDSETALDQAEAALAPLLPSSEDWRKGVDQVYGR